MEKNKTGKYLKYAIGEIILVVIGILIALQINNWNQEKINRDYELIMLNEIEKALHEDVSGLKGTIEYLEEIQKSVRELAIIQDNPDHLKDSISYHINLVSTSGIAFRMNSSAYESIKSNGLNKISNPKLRNALVILYEDIFKGADFEINQIIGEKLKDRDDFMRHIFEVKVSPDSVKGVSAEFIIDYDMISEDPNFDKFLFLSGEFLNQAKWIILNVINHITNTSKQLAVELKE
tara:strand:- start:236 stop:940 length:705 start_codon:yes stop_codon:yes gene_type:complete